MDPEEVGSALTGQRVEPAAAVAQWDDYLQRPGNRQALLQMGLQMMQPVGIGQTVGGHIAQSVGAGGEAVARGEAQDLKERAVEDKLAIANERLRIAQQNADSSGIRASAAAARKTSKKVGGLTELMRTRFDRQDAAAYERRLERDASDLMKQANDLSMDPNADVVKKYRGKTPMEIREMLRAERPRSAESSVALPGEDEDEDAGSPVATLAAPGEKPPVEGARLAADGNYYVQKDGKWFRVKR